METKWLTNKPDSDKIQVRELHPCGTRAVYSCRVCLKIHVFVFAGKEYIMLTIEEIKQKKQEYHYTNEHLARLSGVPLGTVQKVMSQVTRSPRYETLRALSSVFEPEDPGAGVITSMSNMPLKKGPYDHAQEEDLGQTDSVRENPAYAVIRNPLDWNTHVYDRQGTYTIDDYLALPDEQRVELIDGYFYDMAAPTAWHQLIGGEIHAEIRNFIRANKGDCVPFIAPTDVQLDMDNRTMVQPDVMVICHRDRINRKRIFGSPDFVVEVLSPSTRNKDILIKSNKYCNAGVQEFWLVDPDHETVTVFDFREDVRISSYTFEDRIPVLIYDGRLEIDMKEISDYLKSLEQ